MLPLMFHYDWGNPNFVHTIRVTCNTSLITILHNILRILVESRNAKFATPDWSGDGDRSDIIVLGRIRVSGYS